MKGYVITIETLDQSVQCAERCIKSASRHGFFVTRFAASTQADNPLDYLAQEGVGTEGFKEVYSRFHNCVAAFTSHYRLWQKSVEENETLMVLEHDAYFLDPISGVPFSDILSFGRPSYGNFVTPNTIGKNKLISKQYLPGAHAYAVTPSGAGKLIAQAKVCAKPTDVFICNANFDNIEEYYPWPIEVRDSFTTIQKERGCLSKHNYNENYRIL